MRLIDFLMIFSGLSVGLLIFLIFLLFLGSFGELLMSDGSWKSVVIHTVGS
jgi:hypothetical protein